MKKAQQKQEKKKQAEEESNHRISQAPAQYLDHEEARRTSTLGSPASTKKKNEEDGSTKVSVARRNDRSQLSKGS